MIETTCKKAGTQKTCPKKATELFYAPPPKAPKALPRPFLTEADDECSRLVVMRSADALVTACLVDSLDDLSNWHAVNNGRICQAFAGAVKGTI